MEHGTFRIRLNCIDHYQAIPTEFDPPLPQTVYSQDASKDAPQISVIRIFGATDSGQKVLMHVHGALQYTYIEYGGSLQSVDVNAAINKLWLAIDHALAVSYRKNFYDGKNRYVAHISLVKGIPFYGYHVGYKFYFKIYLFNPLHMTRLADLLREGAVMKRVLQPYESHLQYLAQWMCDYNLYGCDYIECAKVKFRSPVPQYLEMTNRFHHWHDYSIPPESISDAVKLPKLSHCALEVDVCVQDILNRKRIEQRLLHHDFIERTNPLPSDVKLVHSMAGLWRDETRRRKARMGIRDPSSSPFPPDVLISMSADRRNSDAGGWIHEDEFRTKVEQLIHAERQEDGDRKVDFEHFVKPVTLEDTVQTALESVEDLYPPNVDKSWISATEPDWEDFVPSSQPSMDAFLLEIYGASQDTISSSTIGLKTSLTAGSSSENPKENSSPKSTVRRPISSGQYSRVGAHRAGGDLSHVDEDDFDPLPKSLIDEAKLRESSLPVQKQENHNSKKRKRVLRDEGAYAEEAAMLRNLDVDLDPPPQFLIDEAKLRDSSLPVQKQENHNSKKRKRVLRDEGVYAEEAAMLRNLDDDLALDGRHRREAEYDEQALGLLDVRQDSIHNLLRPDVEHVGREIAAHNAPSSSGGLQKGKLPFSVVKNPNDNLTLARLSQQSSSSQHQQAAGKKTTSFEQSPKRNTKSVSFATDESSDTIRLPDSFYPLASKQLNFEGFHPPDHGSSLLIQAAKPPTSQTVAETMSTYGLPDMIYQDAYYGKEKDVPGRPREYAGKEFKLGSNTLLYLPEFDADGQSSATFGRKPPILIDRKAEEAADRQRRQRATTRWWNVADTPPRRNEVIKWLEGDHDTRTKSESFNAKYATNLSQIDGPTPKNKYGFKYSQQRATTSVQYETQYMSLMSLEIHVNTRGSLAPNPELDQVSCIFWCVQNDDEDIVVNTSKEGRHLGILAVADSPAIGKRIARNIIVDVEQKDTELEVLTRLIDIVRMYDPEILTGFEVHNSSWGYLIERARLKYDLNLCDEISRMKSQSHGRFGKDEDRWGFNHTSTIRVTGRHTINIWRAMRGELNLLQYTMENVVHHLLNLRIPHYAFADLTKWYKGKNPRDFARVIEYFATRVQLDLEILQANELVSRTSEQARLLGVDWFSVISRGSQFKVESLMFRIAKPENFILVSPSRRQVGGQNALECLPLVMEPQSDFYTSPMLVLDFQSLYPSVMIAYNYCYSTFLGRIVSWRGTNKMGFSDYPRQQKLLELLKDHINIAPNGIMYVKDNIRRSLLAKMLSEILETRVMVKSGMKVDKDDNILQTLLNNRQLALKLIANVTYGYTSASFSGRMPCSEIADSIVQTGRETLEKAIALIHSVERWGAEVVYGDTDSLFVHLKGRTREQAFDIGEEIADTITKMNPRPVKLKFEKVYHPCVLLAKKRYVGFKYESRTQAEPEFEAKGIETVRRDGTPAEQKIEETVLKMLFREPDLSKVKSYFQAQCSKIMRGKVSIQDFCFAKEVKLGTYSEKGPPPPGALISARRMMEDPRLEPQYGERVPYVVVTGGPGARLIDRCVAPEVLLNDAQSELDAEYYISKNIIPPLERIFNLVGANVRQWYDEMPKYKRIRRVDPAVINARSGQRVIKRTIESYMKSSSCLVCQKKLDTDSALCKNCIDQAPLSLLYLRSELIQSERKAADTARVCRSCSGLSWTEEIRCDSKDCPVFYSRIRQATTLINDRAQITPVLTMLENNTKNELDW